MDLLRFAIDADCLLINTKSDLFAKVFVSKKIEYFNKYSHGLVTSNSHGTEFFLNIIKHWDNPDGYYKPDPKNKSNGEDYELNFIKILKLNKNGK